MKGLTKNIKDSHAVFTIILAWCLWFLIFRLPFLNFWLTLSIAVIILSSLALKWGAKPAKKEDFSLRALVIGGIGAGLLYAVFLLGKLLATSIFPFAAEQIAEIYSIRLHGEAWLIVLVLLFITSPGEEIFWRAFLQKWAMKKFGRLKGFWLISLLYAAVHLISGSLMLVLAALVAGLFWGLLYLWEENIVSLIISHALWTVAVFVFYPML